MAKLYFRYGPMNSGKSRQLISVFYNYKERGMQTYIMKPSIATKGDDKIVPRNSETMMVDHLITKEDNLFELIKNQNKKISCILIDEAQFLEEHHVDELTDVVDYLNIPVICYGLLKDFTSHLFVGSKRLVETANSIEEIKTVCSCGNKATEVIRYVNGIATDKGKQIVIDGANEEITYDSLCRFCKKKILKKGD